MYVCNCHTSLQTRLKITNRQHTRHSLFFNYQSPCVYTYLAFLTYHVPLQQEIWLAVHSISNLIGVTYIHLSLIHSLTRSLTHWPVHNIHDAPTKTYFFSQKNNSKMINNFRTNWIWLYIETRSQFINKKHSVVNERAKLVLALFYGGKILGKILGHIRMFHTKMFSNGGRRILELF